MDGPSAGVAMAVVAVSALTGQPVDGTAACTGEISVQGRVKAVGGVPAKVEAARRAGLKKVFIPAENAGEGMLCQGIEVHPVETLQQVLTEMLLPPVTGHRAPGRRAALGCRFAAGSAGKRRKECGGSKRGLQKRKPAVIIVACRSVSSGRLSCIFL